MAMRPMDKKGGDTTQCKRMPELFSQKFKKPYEFMYNYSVNDFEK